MVFKIPTERKIQEVVNRLTVLKEETKEEVDKMLSPSHSVSENTFALKAKLNQLTTVNSQKQTQVESLCKEVQVLEKALKVREDSSPEVLKFDRKLLKSAIEESERLKLMKRKEEKTVFVWKERMHDINQFYDKITSMNKKSQIAKDLAIQGLIKVHRDTIRAKRNFSVEKFQKKSNANSYEKKFIQQRSEIKEVTERISMIKLAISNRRLHIEKTLLELEKRIHAKVQLDKVLKDHRELTQSLQNSTQALNDILISFQVSPISEFSDSEVLNLIDFYYHCQCYQNSLSCLFQQLTHDYVAKQKQYQELFNSLAALKDGILVHSYGDTTFNLLKARVEDKDNSLLLDRVKNTEKQALTYHLIMLNIAQQNLKYIQYIDSHSDGSLEKEQYYILQSSIIKELGKGFLKKKEMTLRSVSPYSSLGKEKFERETDKKLKTDYFSLQSRDISTLHFEIQGNKKKSRAFGRFIKKISIVSYFLHLNDIKDYLSTTEDAYRNIKVLIERAHNNFNSQAFKLIDSFSAIMIDLVQETPGKVPATEMSHKLPTIVHKQCTFRGRHGTLTKYQPIDTPKNDKEADLTYERTMFLRKHTNLFGQDIKSESKIKKPKQAEFRLVSPFKVQKELVDADKRMSSLRKSELKMRKDKEQITPLVTRSPVHSTENSKDYFKSRRVNFTSHRLLFYHKNR